MAASRLLAMRSNIQNTDKNKIYNNIDHAPDCVPVKNINQTAAMLMRAKTMLRLAPTCIRRATDVASPK
jgi:hypothetical protein